MKRHRRRELGARWFARKSVRPRVQAPDYQVRPYPERIARLFEYDRRAEYDPCVCDFIMPSFDRLVEVCHGR